MNKHQKRAHRPGEPQVSKQDIPGLLELSESADPEDRLVAARYLCPCHVRTRIAPVWDALYRMMEDADPRVRQQAWHTIEDGGKPGDEASAERLQSICARESDPKVRRFAETTLNHVLGNWRERDLAMMRFAGRSAPKQRGKCDFCGETEVFVEPDMSTMIPTDDLSRAALICEPCKRQNQP